MLRVGSAWGGNWINLKRLSTVGGSRKPRVGNVMSRQTDLSGRSQRGDALCVVYAITCFQVAWHACRYTTHLIISICCGFMLIRKCDRGSRFSYKMYSQ
jgi:hypothetical protein